jgi:nucleotide-binding universal stress UspA family protein
MKGGDMYQSILLPLDGSQLAEAILPEIEELAKLLKARINLIRVSRAFWMPGADPTDAQVKVTREAQEYLENLKEQLLAKDIDAEIHAAYGNAAEKILEVCRRHDIDLIAMSTHGRSGVGRWLLGSVAEKVVRHSEKPVLLLRARDMDTDSLAV